MYNIFKRVLMKIQSNTKYKKISLFALFSLALLPGCDWLGSKKDATATNAGPIAADDASTVIVSIDGKPVITEKRLQQIIEELVEMQPQYKVMLQMMDRKQLEQNIVDGLVKQEIIDHYIAVNNLQDTPEYQAKMDRVMKMAKQMVNAEQFTKNIKVNIGDSEVKEFYEKNKDVMPQLLISRGGVNAVGVEFDSEADAQAFLAKAKAEFGGDLKKAADKLAKSDRFKDFKLVNSQSVGIDPTLRQKISAIAKAPTTEVVKLSKDKVWVIKATEKEDAKYRPLEQIKDDLKAFLEKEKLQERINEEIEKLHKNYKVEMNTEYFKPEEKEAEAGSEVASNDTSAAPVSQPNVA